MLVNNIVVNGSVYKANYDEYNMCQGCAFNNDYDGCTEALDKVDCNLHSISWVLNSEQKYEEKERITDAVVEELRNMLLQRSQTGIAKYGTTLDRTDLKPSQWCQHLLEELLDASGYVLRLKKDLEVIESLSKGR